MKNSTVIATNRFGLGARPGDLDTVDRNPQSWLLDQLQGPSRLPPDIRTLPHSSHVLVDVEKLRRAKNQRKRSGSDEPAPEMARMYGRTVRNYFNEQAIARYRAAAASDYPFHERLVHFWSNHFAVSAAEQHPAMILFLNNERSIGPNSELGRRAKRRAKTGRRVVALEDVN